MATSLRSQNGSASKEAASDEEAPRDIGGTSTASLSGAELSGPGFTWLEVGIIAGIWALLTAVSVVRTLTSPCCAPSGHAETMLRVTSILSYHSVWFLFTVPVFWACRRLQPRRLGWARVLAGHVALAFGILIVVELGFDYIRYGLATVWSDPDPIRAISAQTTEMFSTLSFLSQLPPYLLLLFFGVGRDAYLRYRARRAQAERLQRESEQLRAQLTSARLEALRMQINPHFLYNTLHTISTMAGHDPDGIRNATARLSEMMRYALSTSDRQEVPLEEELEILGSYLEIQKLRLEDRLVATVDVDPGVRNALVPTLLLQPLAENAVKHGFEGAEGAGRLHVRAKREGDHLVIEVSDDGKGLADDAPALDAAQLANPDAAGEGIGLGNLAKRLDGLYGDAASLAFERSEGGGLRVTIRLPFHTREAARNLRTSGIVAE